MSLYKFVGRKNRFYELFGDSIIKLNYNCPEKYKDGEGQGSCKGYKPGTEKPEKTINKPKAIDSSKSTSVVTITTSKDYKAASPEQKAEFLRSEISKGKQSTQLSDGTSINNISNKLKLLEKKISSNPITTSNINIKQVKSVIAKVKKEQTSGKVSRNTINELKNAIETAKQTKTTNNTHVNTGTYLDINSAKDFYSKSMNDLSEYTEKHLIILQKLIKHYKVGRKKHYKFTRILNQVRKFYQVKYQKK